MKYAIALVLLLASAITAHAKDGTLTGMELRDYCRSAAKVTDDNGTDDKATLINAMNTGYCYGYMMGFFQTVDGSDSYDNDKKSVSRFDFVDRDLTVAQLAEMYVKYLDEHPEDLDTLPSVELCMILFIQGKAQMTPINAPLPTPHYN